MGDKWVSRGSRNASIRRCELQDRARCQGRAERTINPQFSISTACNRYARI